MSILKLKKTNKINIFIKNNCKSLLYNKLNVKTISFTCDNRKLVSVRSDEQVNFIYFQLYSFFPTFSRDTLEVVHKNCMFLDFVAEICSFGGFIFLIIYSEE